jgi:hypothetical protein
MRSDDRIIECLSCEPAPAAERVSRSLYELRGAFQALRPADQRQVRAFLRELSSSIGEPSEPRGLTNRRL